MKNKNWPNIDQNPYCRFSSKSYTHLSTNIFLLVKNLFSKFKMLNLLKTAHRVIYCSNKVIISKVNILICMRDLLNKIFIYEFLYNYFNHW